MALLHHLHPLPLCWNLVACRLLPSTSATAIELLLKECYRDKVAEPLVDILNKFVTFHSMHLHMGSLIFTRD